MRLIDDGFRDQHPIWVQRDRIELAPPLPCLRELGVLPKQSEFGARIALAHHRKCGGLEARDDGAIQQSVTAQRPRKRCRQRRPIGVRRLHLDIETGTLAHDGDYLIQAEHRLRSERRAVPRSRVQRFDLRQGPLTHWPYTIRCAPQIEVVKDHQRLVTSQLHIQFDHVDTEFQRSLERRLGMFRRAAGGAAVGDAQPPLAHGRGIMRRTQRVKPPAIARGRRAALRCVAAPCDRKSVPSKWFECTVEVGNEHSDAVANFLIDNGAPGLQSTARHDGVEIIAYFSSKPPVRALRRFCISIGCRLGDNNGSIRVRQVPHEDWAENWKLHFQPQALGTRLYICPPWDCVAPAGRASIVIDPGMAFGTGQHASTRGCLLLLERATGDRAVRRALDIGTGSGVLAIALAKLGLLEVWAVDTDVGARMSAAANSARNGVEARVHIRSSVDEVCGAFDLVTANLFANLLEEMAVRVVALLRPGGVFICSGFLNADELRVRRAYEAHGLRLGRRHEEQAWVTLSLQRSTP
jgi:ribosomal protein L11 methyltransferase